MSATTSAVGGTLGKDQFLNLFVKQAQMQDPMNPMDTSGFLAQLAQFTSVEQLSNLDDNFAKLLSLQQTGQAAAFIGKTVMFTGSDSETAYEGRVSGVYMGDDGPQLLIGNQPVDIDRVISIYESQQQDQ